MKPKQLLVLLFIIGVTAVHASVIKPLRSCAELVESFSNPPATFRTMPFWVWHDKVDSSKILRDLEELKRTGFGGGFIHPRYGLITEYLSDDWFDHVQFAVEEAEHRSLMLWIYDENSFPSGFAGGWVPEVMPESYNQGQGLVMKQVEQIPDGDFALILEETAGTFRDVSAAVKPGDKGRFIVFEKTFFAKSKWYAGRSYVDLLLPGVTQKFIELTMKGYEERCGTGFGRTVPGVFTDEPNTNPMHRDAVRWTPRMFDEFQQRRGYDPRPHLVGLFEESGDWQRLRHDYYLTILEMFIEHWSKPWYEYTEKHGLLWTGHYWEHGWPNPIEGPDNMAMYAWHQMPGIDMLFNTMDQDYHQFGNIRAVKELRSAANQMGRQRTLSETYGAAGWELTFADMKRLGDWEYVLGVNFMNQHLTFMNLTGDRKHDFPQGFCYQTPWWPFYRVLNDYFARLSLALSAGEQINDILVLEPTTTGWMYYSPTSPNRKLETIDRSFHEFLTLLEKYHVEYDLGCENIIKDHGSVQNGRLTVGKRAYTRVVLPPGTENLEGHTFELLRAFLAEGGTVSDFSGALSRIDGRPDDRMKRLTGNKNWRRFSNLKKWASSAASEFVMSAPETIKGNLLHMRRVLDDGQLVFLVNSSLKETASGVFRLPGKSALELNLFRGDTAVYPVQRSKGHVMVSFSIPPAGSLLLMIDSRDRILFTQKPSTQRVIQSAPSVVTRRRPNMLPLDYCDLKLGDQEFKGLYFYTAGYKIWQAHGYEENPWVSSVQWKTEWVDADTFKQGSGFEARYHFVVSEGVDLTQLKAVVEQPILWKVLINNHLIEPLPDEWAIDQTWGVFDLSRYARIGGNDLTLVMQPMSIYAELEPVYVMGDFNVEPQPQGWKLTPAKPVALGSWKKQGLPFYAYEVGYRKSAVLRRGQKTIVRLGEWKGTVAAVTVNGKQAGIIAWPPYELDVTPFVQDGENQIEVLIVGSLKNLLGPFHKVTHRGIVTPWSFKYAPEKQPAGDDYDLLDYGLMEEFEVMTD